MVCSIGQVKVISLNTQNTTVVQDNTYISSNSYKTNYPGLSELMFTSQVVDLLNIELKKIIFKRVDFNKKEQEAFPALFFITFE